MAANFLFKVDIYNETTRTWEELQSWRNPYEDTSVLDESLDSAGFTIVESERDTVIPPFTTVRLTTRDVSADTEEVEYYVTGDCEKELVLYK